MSSAVGALLLLALVVLCLKRKTTPKSFQKPKTGAFTAEDAHVAAEAKEERTSYGPGVRGDPEEQSKVPLTLVHAEVVHSGQRRLPDETLTPSQVPLGILVGRSPTGSRNHTPLPSGGDRTRRNDTKADDGSIWKAQETESPSVLVTTTSLDSLSGDRTGDGEPTSGSRLGSDIAEMVLMAAQELADRSSIPGLSDAAALVSVLVQLVSDHSENENAVEGRLRWCRSIIILLSRASELLDKVRARIDAESRTIVFVSFKIQLRGGCGAIVVITVSTPLPIFSIIALCRHICAGASVPFRASVICAFTWAWLLLVDGLRLTSSIT